MNEIIKTPGTHIEYAVSRNKSSIILGDDDLSINLKNRERDEAVTIDVCSDRSGNLTMGTAAGLRYVAQIEIPARQYEEQDNPNYDPESEPGTPEAQEKIITVVPFDINGCTIYLWGMEE